MTPLRRRMTEDMQVRNFSPHTQNSYVQQVSLFARHFKRTLTSDGYVIIATFAIDGPVKCSGLEVARYDASAIAAELGEGFRLLEQVDETHTTPWGTEQKFSYFRFARSATTTS